MGYHTLVQGIFPIQGSNLGLPHCRRILYFLSHQGSPYICVCVYISTSFLLIRNSQHVVSELAAPVSPEKMLDMQMVGPHLDLLESELLRVGSVVQQPLQVIPIHDQVREAHVSSPKWCTWSSLGLAEDVSWVAIKLRSSPSPLPLSPSPPSLSQHLQLHFSSWPRVLSPGREPQSKRGKWIRSLLARVPAGHA